MEANTYESHEAVNMADAFVLRHIIHDMVPLVNKKFELYQELTEKLQEKPVENRNMCLSTQQTIFTHKPGRLDMTQLETQLSKLKPRLRQLAEERKKRKIANDAALNDLVNEIELLKKEVSKFSPSKRQFVTPKRKILRMKNIRSERSLPL
jgi:predicted nuclease with TOPRIM domain